MKKETSVSFDEAIDRSLKLVSTKPPHEWVSIFEALGRTLARNITCKKNLPSYNNAAMDGFAIKHEDAGKTLNIKATILAGDVIEACLGKNECYKIMTGAKVPLDANTIIPFEDCLFYDDRQSQIPLHVKRGNAFRFKGEEQEVGSQLFSAGEVLNARGIALLASQGIAHIEVYKQLHIAVFSTGDELKKPWEEASEDEIYDVNALSLIALLTEHGFKAHYGGVIPDNLDEAKRYLSEMKRYDAIVTSGGVSMGEADFVEKALVENGFEASFHGINIKPGKPTMMGKMGETIVASMPGNPLAAFVNALLFLVPVLKKLQGQKFFNFDYINAINKVTFKVKAGRVNIVLGELKNGEFKVYGENKYGSGMIAPLVNSTAILITDDATSLIREGDNIKILPMLTIFSQEKASFKN